MPAKVSEALDVLFQPFSLKSLRLKNRLVMAPMTRAFCPDGIPTADVAAYYARRAENEIGLILTEGVGLDRSASRHLSSVPVLHGDGATAGWTEVVSAAHRAGAGIAPQLWHVGGHADPLQRETVVHQLESASGLVGPDSPGGRPMSQEVIADTVASFARAARTAVDLGFDALEIHAAHGYLIDQFFWAETNRRRDRYGGPTIAERTRFAAEIVAAVRAAVGPDFPLIMRISQWKLGSYEAKVVDDPRSLEIWLAPLVAAGVDMFHCSQRRFWEPAFVGSDLNLAGWAKRVTGVPTITVGSIGLDVDVMSTIEGQQPTADFRRLVDLCRRMAAEEFNLVALGRVLLADAAWIRKVRSGNVADVRHFDLASLTRLE